MKVYRSVAGRLRFVVSCMLGLAVVLASAAAFGATTTSSAGAAGTGAAASPARPCSASARTGSVRDWSATGQ